jgi:hypothetical protein
MLFLLSVFQLMSWWPATAKQPPAPSLPQLEQQAVAYIRAQYPKQRVCVAPGKKPLSLACFQEVLFALDHTYTMAYLDSVDRALVASLGVRGASRAQPNPASCPWEVVISPRQLANFLVCEVFPAGDRTFTATHMYLFAIKAQQVRLLRKIALSYN